MGIDLGYGGSHPIQTSGTKMTSALAEPAKTTPFEAEVMPWHDPYHSKGYNMVHWTQGGMNYWAISDMNASELGEIVQILRGTK